MAVDIAGVVVVGVFYLIILLLGVWAGRKSKHSKTIDGIFLANRDMGFFVSLMSLTATNVGGAYVNGTAEIVASSGVLWAQAPIGFCIGLFIGGWFYGPKMRKARYVTMYDPFQEKYGAKVGALMCIPEFVGDIFWTAAILSALGSTMSIILDIDTTLSIIVSACIAVTYTFLGGLWSVALTDILQLTFIAVGLIIAFPFALTHPAVDLNVVKEQWAGTIEAKQTGAFLDVYGLLIMGGIPWQPFYQRVLACRTVDIAKKSLMLSSILCLLFAVPPAIIGAVGGSADWNQTLYSGELPLPASQLPYILPLSLKYLCPRPVAIIGLAAISAAAMSSADSTTLSTASVMTNNIYRGVLRKTASERELIWVLRISVVIAGALGTILAVTSSTVYGLYVMSGDLMYVILFPQFTCVLFIGMANAYGALTGLFLSVILRLLCGESLIGLPSVIQLPFFDPIDGQLFPFRTCIMLLSFATILMVSWIAEQVFKHKRINGKYDVLACFEESKIKKVVYEDKKEETRM